MVEKKRKRPLLGRAEHVDEVAHSGTWHYQVSGRKTWWIRPHAALWDTTVPDLSRVEGAVRSDRGAWRLPIHVDAGDFFILNTRIWYHHTDLENNDWSISVARDFYVPLPCPRNAVQGEILMEEDEIPFDIPRSRHPNCGMAEIADDNEVCMVLIALENISKGTPLAVKEEDGEEVEYNDDEAIDPRAIARQSFEFGQVVDEGDIMPDDLPRSLDPNCELCLEGETFVLRALRGIEEGEVFCILPSHNEQYEEVEVDLSTGTLTRN